MIDVETRLIAKRIKEKPTGHSFWRWAPKTLRLAAILSAQPPSPEDTRVQYVQQMHAALFFRLRSFIFSCYIDAVDLAIVRRTSEAGREAAKPEEASTWTPFADIEEIMRVKRVEPRTFECTTSSKRPFGCMELWAGNERAHRSLELAGLQTDVIAVPSGGARGGDLCAVFSCSDDIARVVLADCVGHGYTASGVARHVHHLLHKFQDIRDTAGLLGALNDAFTLSNEKSHGPLRLTTVVTGSFDARTGEFNFAYAAHPRMLLWREREKRFLELGEGLEGLPLGFVAGETYNQQSIRMNPGDMIL